MIAIRIESGTEQDLSFDIRRAVILGVYIKAWRKPEYRVALKKPETGVHVEIYYFPAVDGKGLARFATVGLSHTLRSRGQAAGAEWMMALTHDLGGESVDRVFTYLCELINHHMEAAPDSRIPRLMNERRLISSNRPNHAFLLDELREESEQLEDIQIGDEVVRILWWCQSLGMKPH